MQHTNQKKNHTVMAEAGEICQCCRDRTEQNEQGMRGMVPGKRGRLEGAAFAADRSPIRMHTF
jgi:hypothetical protein